MFPLFATMGAGSELPLNVARTVPVKELVGINLNYLKHQRQNTIHNQFERTTKTIGLGA